MLASLHHWWSNPAWLTVILLAATALFTGLAAVVTYQIHKHGRDLAGRRKPVVAGSALSADAFFYSANTSTSPAYASQGEEEKYRIGYVHLFNHSDSEQAVAVRVSSHIFWPRKRGTKLSAITQSISIPAHDGGGVAIVFKSSTGEWPRDDLIGNAYQRRYFVRLIARTAGLRKIKYRGRILLTSYEAVRVPRHPPRPK
jgi:hypothetical protein